MIYGIGTDILNVNHIRRVTENPNDPFVQKTYTAAELELIFSRPVPLYSFATRFCGKEAVFKSLSVSGNALRLNEIEILETSDGQPFVTLHGSAKKLASEKGISQMMLSLSYDTDYAVAYAAALKKIPSFSE